MQNFTHYWSGASLDDKEEGKALDHTAGSDFTKRGVNVGDRMYVVNIRRGAFIWSGGSW